MCCNSQLNHLFFSLSSSSKSASSSSKWPYGSDEIDAKLLRTTRLSLLDVNTNWSWKWLYRTLQTLKHDALCTKKLNLSHYFITIVKLVKILLSVSSSFYASYTHFSTFFSHGWYVCVSCQCFSSCRYNSFDQVWLIMQVFTTVRMSVDPIPPAYVR